MSRTEQKRFEALLESKQSELAGKLGNRDGISIEKTGDPLGAVQSAGERAAPMRIQRRYRPPVMVSFRRDFQDLSNPDHPFRGTKCIFELDT
jgi:hypothetical protein